MIDSKEFLSDYIMPDTATQIVPAIYSAYSMAYVAADAIDFLHWELSDQILPHLKNMAVEFELKRRADEGSIPFSCSIGFNQCKNCKHVELRNDGLVITISQVKRSTFVPRDAVYRNTLCLDGQYAMETFDPLTQSTSGEIYAILTHGWQSQTPSFVNCGILSPNQKFWAQQIDLLHMAHYMNTIDQSPVTEEIKLEFIEDTKSKLSQA